MVCTYPKPRSNQGVQAVQTVTVTAGVIINENKVLIARRSPTEKFAGGWEFRGNWNRETKQECLVRELKEELAIDVEVGDLCQEVFYDYGIHSQPAGVLLHHSRRGLAMTVHDNYRWVEIERLMEYDLLPADGPIARKLIERHR